MKNNVLDGVMHGCHSKEVGELCWYEIVRFMSWPRLLQLLSGIFADRFFVFTGDTIDEDLWVLDLNQRHWHL